MKKQFEWLLKKNLFRLVFEVKNHLGMNLWGENKFQMIFVVKPILKYLLRWQSIQMTFELKFLMKYYWRKNFDWTTLWDENQFRITFWNTKLWMTFEVKFHLCGIDFWCENQFRSSVDGFLGWKQFQATVEVKLIFEKNFEMVNNLK